MDLLDQITLLQIAVLEQELLESDVEDAWGRFTKHFVSDFH